VLEKIAPPESTSILVVDDRPQNLTALEAVLEPLRCRLVTARSGQEALRLLLAEQFAVILLDVQMPGMDGFETASYIRDHHRTRSIPIIFLSALSTGSEHAFRGYEAGAVDYIVKPIDPVVIRSKVRVFVELYQRGEQIQRQAEILRLRDLEHARRESEKQRHRRTSLLAATSGALEQRTDVRGRLEQLVCSCVPAFAELAVVESFGPDGTTVALAAANASQQNALYERLKHAENVVPTDARRRMSWDGGHLEAQATRDSWLAVMPAALAEFTWERLEPTSLIVVPLVLEDRRLGRLMLARCEAGASYGAEDFEIACELAKRASMALETSRLYEMERERSRTLQISLLCESTLAHPTVTAASRYIPGAADLEVGGDWSDLIEREDGRVVAVVGDVVGRGIRAATAMGKLRSAIGALALVTDDPAALLTQLDLFASRTSGADMATVICAMIDPGSGTVEYSSAGHLPAVVLTDDGEAILLEDGRGFPLGVDTAEQRENGVASLPEGATLILFTDGLVEAPEMPIDEGLGRLCEAASSRALLEPERLCDEVVDALVHYPRDDVALVCVRFGACPSDFQVWEFPALPRKLGPIRHAFARWLDELAVPSDVAADLVLAFGEACSNAVQHAYRGAEGNVVVHLRAWDGNLVVRVRDTGRWNDRPAPSDGGRGLDIIRAVVDDAHVHGTPYGTTVIMQKRFSGLDDGRQGQSHMARPAVPVSW
jgi:CheY-like chemotaxis protein/serine phosphatase RsbU (regulator of sigma subunit)/anti-sigma regulatory factor (Ser/Thr protein kinase)